MSEAVNPSEVVIRCRGLRKSFHEGGLHADVLQDVNLDVHAGERIAIVGSSGSGKSTLLHLLGGLDRVTDGVVEILGQDVTTMDENQRGRVRNESLGFVYQFHHLLPEFSALENVCMPLLIRGMPVREAEAAGAAVLEKVGLAARTRHKPAELSGGERQRTAIARALVTRPRCVLADEPTGNLDPRIADQVYDMMLALNQEIGTSFIVVTHDTVLAQRMDRSLTLEAGRLVEPG